MPSSKIGLSRRASVEVVRGQLNQLIEVSAADLYIDVPADGSVESAIGLAVRLRELADRLQSHASERRQLFELEQDLPSPPDADELERLASELGAAQQTSEQAEVNVQLLDGQLHAADRAAADVARLASAALPLLSDHCPVCDQAIDPSIVRQRLESLSSESETLIDLRDRLAAARDTASEAATLRVELAQTLAERTAAGELWADRFQRLSASAGVAEELKVIR